MIPFDLFGGNMGMSLFGAPRMFNDMPTPGLPGTGAPDGVADPLPQPASLLGVGGNTSLLGGLGGADPDVIKPPATPPMPTPNYTPVPPSAASQLPPPRVGPGSDKPTTVGPQLPRMAQGGVGPDIPLPTQAQGGVGPDVPVPADPATTGGTAQPAAGATNPDGTPKKSALQEFMEKAGQLDASGGGAQGGLKPANIGSAGQPHIPQGAASLFQQILDNHAKAMPQVGKVPDIPGVLARLGIGR